mgnify:CR=1 FL=1
MFAKSCPVCEVTGLQLSLLNVQKKIFWYIHFCNYKIEPILYPRIRNFIIHLTLYILYSMERKTVFEFGVVPLREMNESKRRQVTFWRKVNYIGTGIILAIVEKKPHFRK